MAAGRAGWRVLGAALGGMACAAAGSAPARAGDPVGEWAGRLVTEAGTCPDAMPSRLLVGREAISFVPGGGVLVLHGRRRADRSALHAQLQLLDMNHKPLPMVFEGTPDADGHRIEGVYGTPTCRARVTLERPETHPLRRLFGG